MTVTFEPWKPLSNDPRFAGRRLLIVGESHYDEGQTYAPEQIRTFTTDIVRTWGAEAKGHQRFFANIFRTLNAQSADHTSEAFRSFWHSVFFYNYVQSFVHGGARVRPTAKMFAESADAFHAVLTDVRPEAVLVMGQTTWDQMSERGAVLVDHDEDGLGSIWRYQFEGGTCLAAHTHHPSSNGYAPDYWRARVLRFLERPIGCSAPKTSA